MEIVLAAVQQHAGSIQYAADTLRNDEQIILAAVGREGFKLWLEKDAWWRGDRFWDEYKNIAPWKTEREAAEQSQQ